MNRTMIFGVVATFFTAVVLVGGAYQFTATNLSRPNLYAMREFRLSMLTDETLRRLHADAKIEVEANHADMARITKEAESRIYAEITECESKLNDVAYQARHYPTGCPRFPSRDRYNAPPSRVRTVDEAYEARIMDGCEYKGTVWEARYSRCLP